MKAIHCIIPVIVIFTIIYTSCEPLETVSDVPEIHFKSITDIFLVDTGDIPFNAADMTFSFIDGDADFGLDFRTEDASNANLILNTFHKVDGTYDSVDASIYGRKYEILREESMVRTGQNKTIKGEIKVQIQYLLDPPFDTLKYDFYIIDRAGHKSNVESTTDIGF